MSMHHKRMLARYNLGSSTALYSAVLLDPIFTPIFASIGFSTAGIAGTSITAAGIAGAIATTALTIGIQALMAPKVPKPESGHVPKQEAIPFRIWGVGRTRLAGSYMLWEAKGQYLYGVQAIAGHRIRAFNRYWLHDDEVFLNPDGTTNNDDNGRYGNNVQILSRLGLPTETAYPHITAGLSAEGVWTTAHRGDGQASLGMAVASTAAKNQATRFPYGAPSLSTEADLTLCWDFRDPAQSPTDPTTWTWTQNSIVILCWHMCFNEFGFRKDYRKAILPVLDMWVEDSDICDEDVALALGGTEKRYQCNGFDTTENGPKTGLNAILATCDGWLCERGDGALLPTVGKFRESRVQVLSDADIIGHSIQYDVLFGDECNRLVPKFTYPATDYTSSDTDFFEDIDQQLISGRELSQDADYSWCHQWRQARRLGKRDWLRLQQKVKGSVDVRLSGINSIYSRWVRLDTPKRMPRLNGKLIENRRVLLALTKGGFTMDIIQHPDNIDEWNPATDEGAQPPVPSKPNASDLDSPVISTVIPTASSGSVYLQVIIIDPDQDDLTPTVRYQVADVGGGIPGAWSEKINPDAVASGGFMTLVTDVVPSDKLLNVEAALINAKGKYSDWSPAYPVTSTSDPVAPGVPGSFTATALSLTTSLSAKAANDNTKAIVFKRGTVSQTYSAATQVGSDIYTPANQTASASDTPGYGHWKYWASSKNGSGLESPTQGTVFVDIYGPELTTNGSFAADSDWSKGTGWTIASGVASHAAGTASSLSEPVSVAAGAIYELTYTITSISGGSITPQLTGGATVSGMARSVAGTYTDTITALTGNTTLAFSAAAGAVASVDGVTLKRIG